MIDDVLFDMNKTRIITYLQTKDDTNYVIPKTVQIIEWRAFSRNKNLQSLTIPASVHTINKNIIKDCSNLKTITFEGTKGPTCHEQALNNYPGSFVINVPSNYEGDTFCGKTVTRQS